MKHGLNKLSQENNVGDMMDSITHAVDHGDVKEAFYGSLIMINHLLWRIQELEGK
jgi:hypothetical protein